MKFALAQMEVIPGNPEKNVRTILRMIKKAKNANIDLIVFPELCLSGYILCDMWANEAFCENLMQYNDILLEASKGIAIAYGNVFWDKEINRRWKDEQPHPNKDGRIRKYNAAYILQNGDYAKRIKRCSVLPEGVQAKTLLPNYRIFDDERYFFSLQDIAKDAGVSLDTLVQPFIIETKERLVQIGFELCEDLWCNEYRKEGKPLNITNILIENGAEVIVNISASPWNYGKNASRDNRIFFLKQEAEKRFVPFLYVNRIGTENNGKNIITYDGGTTVYNSDGQPVLLAEKSYEEKLLIFDEKVFEKSSVERKEKSKIRQKFNAIIKGIQHLQLFTGKNEPLQFVVGLSGGIDSAVVAALLTNTCGKENVLAINMPSRYNIEKTKTSAKYIADKLGIELIIIPIEELAKYNNSLLTELDKKLKPSKVMKELSGENIQAKIRGTSILSNIAGRYGRLMSNNGNKLEIATGYATLYGDVNGAISPIGDLTKTEVFEMANFLNKEIFHSEVIPSKLFPDELFRFDKDKIISGPELKSKQVSPLKFGYHCALLNAFTEFIRKSPEDILKWYLQGTMEKNLESQVN